VLFLIDGKGEQGNLTSHEKEVARKWIVGFKQKLSKARTGS